MRKTEIEETDMLASVAWRRKRAIFNGVGYNWIDTLKAILSAASPTIRWNMPPNGLPINPQQNKEEYYYRRVFEEDASPVQVGCRSLPVCRAWLALLLKYLPGNTSHSREK